AAWRRRDPFVPTRGTNPRRARATLVPRRAADPVYQSMCPSLRARSPAARLRGNQSGRRPSSSCRSAPEGDLHLRPKHHLTAFVLIDQRKVEGVGPGDLDELPVLRELLTLSRTVGDAPKATGAKVDGALQDVEASGRKPSAEMLRLGPVGENELAGGVELAGDLNLLLGCLRHVSLPFRCFFCFCCSASRWLRRSKRSFQSRR